MITEEQLKEAYDRATALGLAPEAREAWSEYWGLTEQRRNELAVMRQVTGPVEVPEDALARAIREYDAVERVTAMIQDAVNRLVL